MKIIAVDPRSKDDTLYLQYQFTNTCNYKCWYCFPGSHEGTHRWPSLELVKTNLGHLIEHYRAHGKKKIVINLTGGEPTLWPDLDVFVKYFYEKYNCTFSLITNGSRTLNWWKTNAQYFDRISISVHHSANNTEHIKTVADTIYEQGVIVEAQVMMDMTNWIWCQSIVNELKTSKRRWMISAKEILVDNEIIYNDQQKEYFKNSIKRYPNIFYFLRNNKLDIKRFSVILENGKRKSVSNSAIIVNDWNHFKGWECNLGVDSIFVDYTGRISGTCGEYLFGKDFYYNLHDQDFTDNFHPRITPVICTKDGCYCTPEVNLKKRIISIKPV